MEEISSYEKSREDRIKENLERMQKLGIVDISLKLKSLKPTPTRRCYVKRTPQTTPSLPTPSAPTRRSSRLQNSTPVSYSEVNLTKSLEDDNGKLMREVGARPEVYDEEHEKLLGNTELSWTLFVDGYGKDGKRIYDPVRGKTCHQCRQKTLGQRTHCSECNMVQGQFCGDCLYMRYGENVLEANQNPNWICPVCRGICNCSLCRQSKGWPPTGTLYRKISSLGYKSVAHYLIQTRRADMDSDKGDIGSKVLGSAKRSLPFAGIEATLDQDNLSKPSCEHLKTDVEPENLCSVTACENGKGDILVDIKLEESTREPLSKPEKHSSNLSFENEKDSFLVNISEPLPEPEKRGILVDNKFDESITVVKTCAETKSTLEVPNGSLITENTTCTPTSETLEGDNSKKTKKEESTVGSEISPKSTKKIGVHAPPDSIAGRLRKRRINTNEEHFARDTEVATPDVITGSSRKKRNASSTDEELGSTTGEKNAEGIPSQQKRTV